eukprot:2058739-Rhodomonas_salina.1
MMCSNSPSICAATASSPAMASNELSKACSCVLASSSASSELNVAVPSASAMLTRREYPSQPVLRRTCNDSEKEGELHK